MFVIGTAGHVDHGKSALVQALTGVDPDRLREEKARGMTIELGFAELTLPGGRHAGIVDVPGHERFIKNMLAGVGGIDLALLVVAADEGIMPQTREHLAILDLLAIERCVVAVSKSDLVDETTIEVVSLDIAAELEGTRLAGAPIVPCSARIGAGLDQLLAALDSQLEGDGRAIDQGRNPRLPIDRVFTVAGFGTVVTGTLMDGELRVGDEVEALPAAGQKTVRARVRGLQNHGTQHQTALPGSRTAVNLGNVDSTEVSRGQILTTAGWLQPARTLEVRLRMVESAPHSLRHNTMVTFHHYASETPARLVLLEGNELGAGKEAWAQLRLSRPVPVLNGDRFVIRDSESTLGGGSVVTVSRGGRAGTRGARANALDQQAAGDQAESLFAAISRRQSTTIPADASFEGFDPSRVNAALEVLAAEGRIVIVSSAEGRLVYTPEELTKVSQGVLSALADFHKRYPMRAGMPREELRSRLKLASKAFDALLAAIAATGQIQEPGPVVKLSSWEARLPPAAEAEAATYMSQLRVTPFAPITTAPSPDVLRYLADTGQIVRLADGTIFDAEAYQRMVELTVDFIRQHGDASLAEVRDLLGTSRRYVQPFLEHLDQLHLTARKGDRRILVNG